MRKEVSGLDWLAAPASLGRGSGALSIPAARLLPSGVSCVLGVRTTFTFRRPGALIALGERAAPPSHWPPGPGPRRGLADWPPGTPGEGGGKGESLARSLSPLPQRIPP